MTSIVYWAKDGPIDGRFFVYLLVFGFEFVRESFLGKFLSLASTFVFVVIG